MNLGLHVKHFIVFFSDFKLIWSFRTDFHKNSSISNFTEIWPVQTAFLLEDQRADELTYGYNEVIDAVLGCAKAH
jgi:hypothetical protein